MPVEYVEGAAAIAANYAAGLNISIDGWAVQPYQPLPVQNGEFHVWLAFGRRTDDGALIAALHIVEQDPAEAVFSNWTSRQDYYIKNGITTEDASRWTRVYGEWPSIEIQNTTGMPIMIFGSRMLHVLWDELPFAVQQQWHALPKCNKIPPAYVIGTRFLRLCGLETSSDAVNVFMNVHEMQECESIVHFYPLQRFRA